MSISRTFCPWEESVILDTEALEKILLGMVLKRVEQNMEVFYALLSRDHSWGDGM